MGRELGRNCSLLWSGGGDVRTDRPVGEEERQMHYRSEFVLRTRRTVRQHRLLLSDVERASENAAFVVMPSGTKRRPLTREHPIMN